jgi:hypothetical protein
MFRRLLVTASVAIGILLSTAAVGGADEGAIKFPHQWGGSHDIPGKHGHNFCSTFDIPAGHSRAIWVDNGYGDTFHGRVYCSHHIQIPGGWTGPWENGWSLSIPCPAGDRPIGGGSGFQSSPEDALTFVGGSWGHNKDGWWHYHFHNWSAFTARIQFWAVCVQK